MSGIFIILVLSLLLQLAAAAQALRLIPLTGRRAAWLLLSAALVLMALRRGITLATLDTQALASAVWIAELTALAISLLMFGGVSLIGSVFRENERVKRDLGEAVDRNESMLDAIPDLLFWFDKQGVILDFRAGDDGLLVMSPERFLGRSLTDVFQPESLAQRMLDALSETLNERRLVQLDYVMEVPAGTRHFEARLVAYGKEQALAIVRDVSDQKRAETALKQNARMEAASTLAGGVAHDYNNLMLAIMGNAELLQDDGTITPDQHEMLEHIIDSARRAGDLAQQLLAFARCARPQTRPVDLSELLAHMLEEIARHSPANVTLEQNVETEVEISVLGDPEQLRQVVTYLLQNAFESIEEQGVVRVSLSPVLIDGADKSLDIPIPHGAYARIRIEDDGAGMDEITRTRLFEPFYTTKFPGRGLGLAASHGIVQGHGGYITVRSSPGEGATLDVYLPVMAEAREVAPQASSEPIILLLDDDDMVRDVSRRMLARMGFQALLATSAAQALAVARNQSQQLVAAMLDVTLTGAHNGRLLRDLKAARPDLIVLLCSGYSRDTQVNELLKSGAHGFLAKPFRAEDLERALRDALPNLPWDRRADVGQPD